MIVTSSQFPHVISRLHQCKTLYVDCETTGLQMWRDDRLCGIAVEGDGQSYYFPFRHGEGENLPLHSMTAFRNLLSSPKITYVGFNYGFDMEFLYRDGVPYAPKIEDVQTMAHLLNENEPKATLKALGAKYIGSEAEEEEQKLNDELKKRKLKKGQMSQLPAELVAPYAEQDVILTRMLHEYYKPYLDKWKIHDLWQEYNEYQLAICEMERHGIGLDMALMDEYQEKAQTEVERCRKKIEELAGYEINLNSAPQLQKWLGLKSTAAKILEKMPKRPGVKELLEYRGWNRVYANYYRKFRETMDANCRLHANLNLVGTETGRLSCSNPPLQAIPRSTDIYRVKDVFVASPGHTILEADYSQAEIRVATHYGNVVRMREKLLRGGDIHSETAEEIGIPRDAAKRLNFSVIYGIGPNTLADNLEIPRKQAREYLNKYHANYPGFKALYRSAEMKAKQRGFIRMFSGRMRHYNTKLAFPHKASSNLVQGTVGEMLRVAITRIRRETPYNMWLTVHDSVLFEIPENETKQAVKDIKRIMEDTPWCSIPMKIDFKAGRSWGQAKEIQYD